MESKELTIIFSGSDTARCGITEATAMEQVYIQMQQQFVHQKQLVIPSTKIIRYSTIIKEERSKNTVENALYCRDIINGLVASRGIRKANIHLVTSDYHMPRAKLLFENIFCVKDDDDDDHDDDDDDNDDDDNDDYNITITCYPADSLHNRYIAASDGILCSYRPRGDRSDDSNEWTLSERLDWELNAISCVNSYLMKYGLETISENRTTRAIQQLQAMNYTCDGRCVDRM